MSIPAPEEVGGEAAGVQLGDVDFLRTSLKVSRQVRRVSGGAIDVRAPKYGSERVIYLADSPVNALAEHVAAHGTTRQGSVAVHR